MAAKRTTRRGRSRTRRDDGPDPTLVLLVRHGRTPTTGAVLPGRAAGLHLAEEGRAQAEAVADRIAALHRAGSADGKTNGVAAVYASPMERTRQTAAAIARAVGLRVRQRAGLNECDFGDWTGRKLEDLYRLPEWKTVQRHPSGFRFPRGESFSEMQTRMVDAVNSLVAAHPGQTVVAVSHADTIKSAVAQALGTPLDLFQRIVIGQCSVSAIVYGPTGPTVLSVNHTGDLASVTAS
jgi:probable phosphomutase (TIGR03848 family)